MLADDNLNNTFLPRIMDTWDVYVIVVANITGTLKFLGPTGTPRNVMFSTTSTSVHVHWTAMNCSERNGFISNYTVEFQETGKTTMNHFQVMMEKEFIAARLTPYTYYTLRVAGVNSNGTGPFTDIITIVTEEDSKLK